VVFGQLTAEPVRRLELIARRLRGELDLRGDKARQVARVDVDLDREAAASRQPVARLRDATPFAERPERRRPALVDLELLLDPDASAARLDRELGPPGLRGVLTGLRRALPGPRGPTPPTDTDLGRALNHDVALLDRLGRMGVEVAGDL
jgi:hypothetical protein